MSRNLGNEAEQKACEYLIQNGYVIKDRNFHSCFGEIDIIATKGACYHFFEVKSGRNYHPLYNITPAKLEKIIKTVKLYLKAKNIASPYSVDAIIITDIIEIYENITF